MPSITSTCTALLSRAWHKALNPASDRAITKSCQALGWAYLLKSLEIKIGDKHASHLSSDLTLADLDQSVQSGDFWGRSGTRGVTAPGAIHQRATTNISTSRASIKMERRKGRWIICSIYGQTKRGMPRSPKIQSTGGRASAWPFSSYENRTREVLGVALMVRPSATRKRTAILTAMIPIRQTLQRKDSNLERASSCTRRAGDAPGKRWPWNDLVQRLPVTETTPGQETTPGRKEAAGLERGRKDSGQGIEKEAFSFPCKEGF